MNKETLEVPQDSLENLLETGTLLLGSRLLKGSLDEKEKNFYDALQQMVADAAVARFVNRLPEPPRPAGQPEKGKPS